MHRALAIPMLIAALALPACAANPGATVAVPRAGTVALCFTAGMNSAPGADCTALVVETIAAARRDLLVQAYNFSDRRIIAAVIAAHRRGVDVTVILDKISPRQKGEGADAVSAAGIPVYIEWRPRIAHKKVMIVDDATVITGSFNFTHSAQCCNAENLLVLRSPELAAAYVANFARRKAVSAPYGPTHAS